MTAFAIVLGFILQSPAPADRLLEHRGKTVVLNFWATWCNPCKKEMPLLVELQREYGSSGVQFIGASIDDESTRKDIPGFLKRYKVDFPIWTGVTPEQQFEFRLATAVPATVIIDKDGSSVFRIIAESPRKALVDRLEWLLSDRSAPAPDELVLPASMTPEHFKQHELGLEEDEEELAADAAASEVPS